MQRSPAPDILLPPAHRAPLALLVAPLTAGAAEESDGAIASVGYGLGAAGPV